MTLSFVFPIQNAWVVVADKLMISEDGYDFDDMSEVRERIDNFTKIEYLSDKKIVFVGAGDVKLLQFFVEKIGMKESLEVFKAEFGELCSNLRAGGEFEKTVQRTEFIIINQLTLKSFRFINGKYKEINEDCFIGCVDKLKNFNDVKSKLRRRKKYKFNKKNNGVVLEWIYCLEELSKQKLSSVGHPAIDGCDIWIVSKNKINKIAVSPKLYDWEVN